MTIDTTSLVSVWENNDASGNCTDVHGSDTLTQNGTVGATTGKISGARNSFSLANYFSKADNNRLSLGDFNWSITAWVYLTDKTIFRTILSKDDGATNREYHLAYDNTADRYRVRTFSSSGGSGSTILTADAYGSPATSTWVFLFAYHDATANQLGISVNDGTVNTTTHNSGTYDGTAQFEMGSISAFGDFNWSGSIDQITLFKRKLSSTEVTELYNGGAGLAYSSWAGGGSLPLRNLIHSQSIIRSTRW